MGKIKPAEGQKPLTPKENAYSIIRHFPLFALLAFCDLAGTTLAGIGLLFVSSSVYQLFRGSIIIFTSIWARALLKHKFPIFKLIGLTFVVSGLILVGLSGILDAASKSGESVGVGKYVLGIVLIITGQLANSTQMIFEEKYLKQAHLHPLIVIGFEGVFGFLMCTGFALPIVSLIPGSNCGQYENVIDGLVQLGQNGFLLAMFLCYYGSISFYNGLGLTVAKVLSSVHRTLIDACRSIVVWITMLLIHYISHTRKGERWNKYSYIQVIGFVLLAFGTLVFNHVLPIDVWWRKIRGLPDDSETEAPLLSDASDSTDAQDEKENAAEKPKEGYGATSNSDSTAINGDPMAS